MSPDLANGVEESSLNIGWCLGGCLDECTPAKIACERDTL